MKNIDDKSIGDFGCEGDKETILIEVKENIHVVKILSRESEKVYSIEK